MRSGKRLIDSRRGRGCVHLLMAVMIFTLVTRVVRSQESDESPDSVDIVARISLLAGEVSYQRTRESGGDWYEATINLPLAESDQLYTGSAGRVEIQISSGDVVRLSHDSNLRFTRFNRAQRQLSLPVGTMTMRIETIDGPSQEEVSSPAEGAGRIDYEVSTPAAAITLRQKGVYRVDVAADGATELHVREGQAEIFRQEIGSFIVGEGRTARVDGTDPTIFSVEPASNRSDDEWDLWNLRRDDELARLVAQTSPLVPRHVPGGAELDRYGEWIDTPEYGRVWGPRGVDSSWAPYRLGYWRWYSSYGWTWISYEPWGWVPYHYGRWAWYRQRWLWVPSPVLPGALALAGRSGLGWRWSPHLVAFIGWGDQRYVNGYRDGFRDGYWTGFRDGRGWVGWCPLAPGEDRQQRPGRRDLLRNYQAPGGVSGIEGKSFNAGSVVRISSRLVAPPRTERQEIGIVRERDLQPGPPSRPTRTPLIDKIEATRPLDRARPLVVRQPLEIRPGREVRSTTTAPTSRPTNDPLIKPPVRSGSYTIPRPVTIPRREIEKVDRLPPVAPRREPIAPRPGIFNRPSGSAPSSESPRRQAPPPVRSIPPRVDPPSPPPGNSTPPARGSDPPARPTRQPAPERPLRPSRELPPP